MFEQWCSQQMMHTEWGRIALLIRISKMSQATLYCGNNELSHKLKKNGGHMSFGTTKQCLNKGIGLGYHQNTTNIDEFLRGWGGPYTPHIVQNLYCGDEPTLPTGYTTKATLNQCFSKGFGIGSLKKARILKSKKNHRETSAKQTPVQGPKQPKQTKTATLPKQSRFLSDTTAKHVHNTRPT